MARAKISRVAAKITDLSWATVKTTDLSRAAVKTTDLSRAAVKTTDLSWAAGKTTDLSRAAAACSLKPQFPLDFLLQSQWPTPGWLLQLNITRAKIITEQDIVSQRPTMHIVAHTSEQADIHSLYPNVCCFGLSSVAQDYSPSTGCWS